LLAKITSVPSGETKTCWSVLPVQSSWGCWAGFVTPGGVENNSLEVRPGHEVAVDNRVLWKTIDPLTPGNAAPEMPGRRVMTPTEAAPTTSVLRSNLHVENAIASVSAMVAGTDTLSACNDGEHCLAPL
jgi:hypothetical protein